MLENLSESQKKLLQIGAPVVAAFALISVIQKRNQPPRQATPPTGALPANLAPTTDAIGTGQLAEFESLLTGQVSQLAQQVAKLPTDIPAPIIQQAPAPLATPRVRSEWYPVIAPAGEDLTTLGTITAAGYRGFHVAGGVPVYAFVNGRWEQNFEQSKLAVGTPLATLDTFQHYIDRGNPQQ